MSFKLRPLLLPGLGLALLSLVLIAPTALAQATAANPTLAVPIPGVKLTDIIRTDEAITIPLLADYLSGVYKYAIGIGALLAAVMMMIGGFQWLMAGGDRGKVGKAKSRITGAVLGLFLLLSSYVLLRAVNPDLVMLKPLRIATVEREEYELPESSPSVLLISDEGVAIPQPDTSNLASHKAAGNLQGNVGGKAIPEIIDLAKKVADQVASQGCRVMYARSGRPGTAQLDKVKKRCEWSQEYMTYVDCKVALGSWGSIKMTPGKSTCLDKDPNTPIPPCDVNSLRHVDAVDMFAVGKDDSDKSQCGTSSPACAKHKCQKVLIKAAIDNGGCVLIGREKDLNSRMAELWHFEIPTAKNSSYCLRSEVEALVGGWN